LRKKREVFLSSIHSSLSTQTGFAETHFILREEKICVSISSLDNSQGSNTSTKNEASLTSKSSLTCKRI